jgi:hypothetical protein
MPRWICVASTTWGIKSECQPSTISETKGEDQRTFGRAHKNKKRNNMKELILTRAQFNIYEVEHYGVEENSLGDLRKAGCTNILVLLRDHDRGLIRVACDLPEGVTYPNQLKLEHACL